MILKSTHKDKIILSNNTYFIFKLLFALFIIFILSNPLLKDSYVMTNFFMCLYITLNLLLTTFTSLTIFNNYQLLIKSIPCIITKKDIFLTVSKNFLVDLSLLIIICLIASIINKTLILPSAFTIFFILLITTEVFSWLEKLLSKHKHTTKSTENKYGYIKRFVIFFLIYNVFRILNLSNIFLLFESNSIIFWSLSIIIFLVIMKLINNNCEFYVSKERR